MELGIMFFSSGADGADGGTYRLLLEAAELADRRGFCAVWTPERHFHEFGGIFPSPAVVSAALAVLTHRLEIRAGSLISPLHQDLRIAEEWSIVDNLSRGRVAISFGSGWNVDDFLCFPDRYARRQQVMLEQIETVRRLWRGDEIVRENSFGKPVRVSLHPRPVQPELPLWLTSSGNVETFVTAGSLGANLLTHLIGQDLARLGEKIERYRAAFRAVRGDAGRGGRGKVALMLHTFLGDDLARVRERVRGPFREYLRSAISLERLAMEGGGAISGGHQVAAHEIPPEVLEELLDVAVERYLREGSLIGTVASCDAFLSQLEELGVDEIACLIDFVDDRPAIRESLEHLAALHDSRRRRTDPAAGAAVAAHFSEALD